MNWKRIARTLGVVGAVLLGPTLACFVFLNTASFRNLLRSEIQKQAEQHIGARVDIGVVRPRWSRLGIELQDIVVYGRGNDSSSEPFFRAKDLLASIRLLPLFRRRLQLRELTLEQPIVRLQIDSQGNSNFPARTGPPPGNPVSRIFDLEIGKCEIRSGEMYYNNFEMPLDAELRGLRMVAAYGALSGKYTGTLRYDRGRVVSRRFGAVESNLQLQFAADRSGISLNPLTVASGASRVTTVARITNYARPRIDATYTSELHTSDLNFLRLDSLPIGDLTIAGSLAYQAGGARSFLQSLNVQGRLRSARLRLRTGQSSLDFRSIDARYELANASLKVQNLSAATLRGQIRGDWEMLDIESPESVSRLRSSLNDISLTDLGDALAPTDIQRVPLAGTLKGDVNASWTGSIRNLAAQVRLSVSSPQQAIHPGSVIPVSGAIEADYDRPHNMISLGRSYLQTANTKISATGMLAANRSGSSNISALATTSDLSEVSALARLVEGALGHNSAIPALAGGASLRATITGNSRAPQIQGQLTGENLGIEDSRWKSIGFRLSAQPSGLRITEGTAVGASSGQASFEGSIGLQHWTVPANGPISLRFAMTGLSLADAQRIAGRHYPIAGMLSANVSVQGTRQNPVANGTLAVIHSSAWNQAIDNLTVQVTSSRGSIHAAANLRFPAGAIAADSTYAPTTGDYVLDVRGPGLQLAKIPALQRARFIQGTADLSLAGRGTLRNPALQADLTIPKLQIQDQAISQITARVSLAGHRANLALHSNVDQGSVEANAEMDLTGALYTKASVDIRALPLRPVLATFVSAQASEISGQTDVHLTLTGPAKTPARMEGEVEIPTLNLGYAKAQLALAQPLRAEYRNGDLILMPTRIQGTGMNLTLGGRIPLHSSSPYSLSADGSMDLGVVREFAPNVRSSGQVTIHVTSREERGPSAIQGELLVKDAVFSTESIPVGIEGLNAQINLSGNRADIVNLSGAAGGGSVSASGFVFYGRPANFNLALKATSVRVRYPEGLRSVLSGQLNLQGRQAESSLTGRVLVDRLSFTENFDLANFAGSFSQTSTGSGSTASAFRRGMKLGVAVQSAQNLNLTSSKVSVGGSANLNVTGTLADPVVLGRIALSSGEAFFLSKRFEIQSGTIEFANPARTEPVLNLHVTMNVEQYRVVLTLSGPLDRLKTTYTSDPALPPADIIHLLAFGRTAEESASAAPTSVASSAESLLAQGVTSQISGKLENLSGISQLTIDPLAANGQGNPGAQVAVQERVTGSLLLTFSTNVTSTQGQTVELQYQLSKRTSVTVLRDQYGGYGIDLRFHREF